MKQSICYPTSQVGWTSGFLCMDFLLQAIGGDGLGGAWRVGWIRDGIGSDSLPVV